MDAYFRLEVWRGSRSGFVAMFARDGHPVHATAVGFADIERELPMELGTRVRIASMTKAVTAVAALILIEEGRLGLDDPVSRWIPAFAGTRVATSWDASPDGSFATEPMDPVLAVRHLLMFASGVGPGLRDSGDLTAHWEEHGLYGMESGSLAERIDQVASLPLFEQPGTLWRYGGSADVLARVVEVAAGEPFDAFLARRIFTPLGMSETTFLPPPGQRSELARVYTQGRGREPGEGSARGSPARLDAGGQRPRLHRGRLHALRAHALERRRLPGRAHPVARDDRVDAGAARAVGRPGSRPAGRHHLHGGPRLGPRRLGGGRRRRHPLLGPRRRLLVGRLLRHHILREPGHRAGGRGDLAERARPAQRSAGRRLRRAGLAFAGCNALA